VCKNVHNLYQLKELDDAGKAEAIETALKVAREDALRKLKDKNELYEDGDNIIKLGKHKFGVNKQQLDLTIVFKDKGLFYHLTGTDFYQELHNEVLTQSQGIWNQELVSENDQVYRSAYLAYSIFKSSDKETLRLKSPADLLSHVQEVASGNYSGGYVKGVHDHDTAQILGVLLHKDHDLGLLTYAPQIRAQAQFFWNSISKEEQTKYNRILKSAGEVLSVFPDSKEYNFIVDELTDEVLKWQPQLESLTAHNIASYLFNELKDNNHFTVSTSAIQLKEAFEKKIKSQNGCITLY